MIADAMSAAPDSIAHDATIVAYPEASSDNIMKEREMDGR